MPELVDLIESLGLSEEEPSESEVLLPFKTVTVTNLDESVVQVDLWPWSLGRFVKAQANLTELLVKFTEIFKGEVPKDLEHAVVLRVINQITPHIRDLLRITLQAPKTFPDEPPKNLTAWVDELPPSEAIKLMTITLQQNWRQLKNVTGLAEIQKFVKIVSARPSNS